MRRLSKVFLNGKLVGVHPNPQTLVTMLRLYKRHSFINCFTSISWNILSNERIFLCSGRLVRPVFALKDDLSNELISDQ